MTRYRITFEDMFDCATALKILDENMYIVYREDYNIIEMFCDSSTMIDVEKWLKANFSHKTMKFETRKEYCNG